MFLQHFWKCYFVGGEVILVTGGYEQWKKARVQLARWGQRAHSAPAYGRFGNLSQEMALRHELHFQILDITAITVVHFVLIKGRDYVIL